MRESFLWGIVAGSSLVLGGLLALRFPIAPAHTRPDHGLRRRRPDQRRRLRARPRGVRDLRRRRRSRARALRRLGCLLPRRHAHRPPRRLGPEVVEWRPGCRLGARDRARNRPRRDPRIARARPHRARGGSGQRRLPRRRLPLEPARGDRGHHRARPGRLGEEPDPRPLDPRDDSSPASPRSPATRFSTPPRHERSRSCSRSPAARS